MTSCAPGYLFIGSRLCDSVFLHCTFEQSTLEESPAKKIKLNAELNANEEDEDFELYGEVLPKVVVDLVMGKKCFYINFLYKLITYVERNIVLFTIIRILYFHIFQ